MKQLLRRLWRGVGLRHLPIALHESSGPLVRLELQGVPGGPRDVTNDHVPVSLRPLVLGVAIQESEGRASTLPSRCTLVVRDIATGKQLAAIDLAGAGTLPLTRGALALFSARGSRNATAATSVRWRRYALAWVHAQRAASRGDGLRMSAADLRCLNVYYMAARPVYLIGVTFGERTNFFPMDLVGRVGTGDYLLALRATSPANELMESSRVIAMSAAPAEYLAAVYALGAHHRKTSVDVAALPFDVRRSPLYGLPVLAHGFTRELAVRATHRVGSHVLFVCRVDGEQGSTPRRLAHVSGMYAEWLTRHGRPLEVLA